MCTMTRHAGTARRRRHGGRWYAAIGLAAAWLGWGMDGALANGVCKANVTGGTTKKGVYYAGYDGASMQVKAYPGRLSLAIPVNPPPRAGDILLVAESLLPNLGNGSEQGKAAPLYDCPPGVTEHFDGNGALINDVYDSGVPGIGYRVYYYYVDGSRNEAAPRPSPNPYPSGALVFPFNGSALGDDLKARIEFVATGEPIQPGVLSPGSVWGQATVTGAGVSMPGPLYRITLGAPVRITPPTCDVRPANVTITLPNLSLYRIRLGEDGGITSATLDVNCGAPSDSSPTITVAASAGMVANGILTNQETGTNAARGVGIKVWLHNPTVGAYTVPAFGQALQGFGAPVSGLPSSDWQFRIGASYAPTGPAGDITSGKVRATATVKFTYI